jgi:hypothetical protein
MEAETQEQSPNKQQQTPQKPVPTDPEKKDDPIKEDRPPGRYIPETKVPNDDDTNKNLLTD